MNARCKRVLLVFFTLALCHVEAAGNNGRKQIPKTGEYCANYFDAYSFRYDMLISQCQNCDGTCTACKFKEDPICPWECYFGCSGSYIDFAFNPDREKYDYICSAGCVSTASCTPISDGYFTGAGTINGNSNSCPFNCNAGFTKSGLACVCPLGQYSLNGVCVACSSVTNGYFTGPGTVVGDANSCPFACNAPFVKSGSACVCLLGQYPLNGACAACTPVANGYFTGPGTVAGHANSCPFDCTAPFVKSGSACVCAAGKYNVNGACTPCQTCDAGKWLQNCAGSDAGQCVACNNA
jgi:hypothetical protein